MSLVSFDEMKEVCRHGCISYDENRIGNWACHHNKNRPSGESWGICSPESCPVISRFLEEATK